MSSLVVAGALAAAVAVAPPPALAGSPVVADCNAHGALTRHYSVAALQSALANMPADVAEYTNCYNLIQHQLYTQLAAAHSSGVTRPTGGGGSFLPTPVIVVVAVLVLVGGALAGVALQRRAGVADDHS